MYVRLQGFEVSRFPRMKVSGFQSVKVLRFQVFDASKFQGFKENLKFLGIKGLRILQIKVSGLRGSEN
jgi:hypothetical protein